MNRLVIVGAGGFGREVHAAVKASPAFRARERVSSIVFIDDEADKPLLRAPIVSSVREFAPRPNDLGLCAIGSSRIRRQVTSSLEARGLRFAPFVEDSCLIGESVRLAEGVIVCANSIITVDAAIGRHTHINCGSLIGHDVTVGEFVTISSAVNLTGNVRVADDASVGTGVTVIPGKTIGTGATVGAGSVVIRNVKPGVTVFGNPAKTL